MCFQLNYWNNFDLLVCKYKRQKRLDGEQLFHSEWNRRLGSCSVAAISGIMTLCLTFYVVLPKLFASYANHIVFPLAPPFAAFALAFVIFFLAAYQMCCISEQLPKSCLLYNFAYSTHSEALAFALGWSQLLDWLAIMTVLVHTLSDSVNLLFHNVIEDNLKMDWLRYENVFGPSAQYQLSNQVHPLDWFALVTVMVCGAILCCSLRVLVTISVLFLVSTLFTVTSTTVVALLHNIAHLRINYLDVPQSFDELFDSCSFFLLGFLAIESLSFLADETEQPAKVIPSVFKGAVKFNCLVTFLALLSFFPFIYRIAFTEHTVLPVVFNSISIFSARYLMNVGSICGLASALLCAFVPTTRLLCAFTEDGLLQFQSSDCRLNQLHGKAGSPRLAVIVVVFLVCLLIVLIPKPWLIQLIPLNLCLRLFSLAVLVFNFNFASEKSSQLVGQSLPTKYNRMRHCVVSSMTNSNSAVSSCSDVEEGGSQFSTSGDIDDEEARLFERMCQMTNLANCRNYGAIGESTECAGQLVPPSSHPNSVQQTYSNVSQHHKQYFPKVHNCLTSPCASSLQISADCKPSFQRPRFHIYDTTSMCANLDMTAAGGDANKKYQNAYSSCQPFVDAESAQKTAQKLLASFVILVVLVAISHKILRETTEFVPILALISAILGLVLSVVIAVQIHRLKTQDDYDFTANHVSSSIPTLAINKRSRWQCTGCQLSIFLLIQLLLQFPLVKYTLVVGWTSLGFLAYSISLCKKNELYS